MPSFVGFFKVVSNAGTLNNGDAFIIARTTIERAYHGSGSLLTGDLSGAITLFSATVTNDSDVIDDSNAKVATGS